MIIEPWQFWTLLTALVVSWTAVGVLGALLWLSRYRGASVDFDSVFEPMANVDSEGRAL